MQPEAFDWRGGIGPVVKMLGSKWTTPIVALLLGLMFLGAAIVGDEPGVGLRAFAVMAAVAAIFAFGGRSETVSAMREPDERWKSIDLKATAVSGVVMATVAVGGARMRFARGEDPGVFGVICVTGGLTYIIALGWLRARS